MAVAAVLLSVSWINGSEFEVSVASSARVVDYLCSNLDCHGGCSTLVFVSAGYIILLHKYSCWGQIGWTYFGAVGGAVGVLAVEGWQWRRWLDCVGLSGVQVRGGLAIGCIVQVQMCVELVMSDLK